MSRRYFAKYWLDARYNESVILNEVKGKNHKMRMRINNEEIYLPPIFLFYGSDQIGAAGFEYCGIIGVATNFTPWFRICILVHELVHYFTHFLPASTRLWIETLNDELFLWKGIHLLDSDERAKGRMNLQRFLHNCWRIKMRFFPDSAFIQ
jgi:hypothetical protein